MEDINLVAEIWLAEVFLNRLGRSTWTNVANLAYTERYKSLIQSHLSKKNNPPNIPSYVL